MMEMRPTDQSDQDGGGILTGNSIRSPRFDSFPSQLVSVWRTLRLLAYE